jgi:Tfp pilus assembly pilus retraction ATPase PilT
MTINRVVSFFPPFQKHQVRVSLASALRGVIWQARAALQRGAAVPEGQYDCLSPFAQEASACA